MILSATLLPFDPMNQGIVEVQLILDNGETDSIELRSGMGNPSRRILDHFEITIDDFNNDKPIMDADGESRPCSLSLFLGGCYETDVDLRVAEVLCNCYLKDVD